MVTRGVGAGSLGCAIAGAGLVVATRGAGDGLFVAMAQMATMGLYVSYALPIFLGALARRRGAWRRRGPFSLGRLGAPIAWGAVLWTGFVLVVCTLPPNRVAGGMLAGMVVVLAVVWVAVVRRRFAGPEVSLAALERE